jgi:hypothetical protein
MATTATTKTLVEQFKNIRRVATPLVQITTADPASVASRITADNTDKPVVQWDASAGFWARTKAGQSAMAAMMGKEPGPVLNAADAVFMARNAPAETILFIFNAQRVWQDITTAQGIWNLRDMFKANSRTLVLLTTAGAVAPVEISTDLIVVEDPLPDVEQIAAIITNQCKNAHPPLPVPDTATMERATDAMKGLSPFIVEQSVALALTRKGVNVADLWQHKKAEIKKTPGATIYEGSEKFADIGGHEGLKKNLQREINGKRKIKVVVIMDEFEKMMAGASSEHVGDGGVAKDSAQVVLTNMQDHKYGGMVLYGHPGAGKTVVAKALGNEADVLVIQADMGAMKASHVGESEQNVRAFFNMLLAIAGEGGAFIVATCNSTGALTTEIRRRFKSGFYFVDLPDRAEKDSIWSIHMKRYGISAQPLPNDSEWTGAEIENCCEKADNYGITLVEAAGTIVPIAKSQPQLIEERRREAHGGMLSAATGETYLLPSENEAKQQTPAKAGGRNVRLES